MLCFTGQQTGAGLSRGGWWIVSGVRTEPHAGGRQTVCSCSWRATGLKVVVFFLVEPHPENPSLFDSSCKPTCLVGFPCRTLGLCDLIFRVHRKTHRKKFECSAFPYNKQPLKTWVCLISMFSGNLSCVRPCCWKIPRRHAISLLAMGR